MEIAITQVVEVEVMVVALKVVVGLRDPETMEPNLDQAETSEV